jgi:hypothetical protein
VLAALDARRAAAFTDPVLADPGDWADPGCACYRADADRLDVLARAGRRLRGAAVELVSVTLARAGPGRRAELLVVDRLPAYDEIAAGGAAARHWPARGLLRWRVTVVDRGGGWRFAAIVRLSAVPRAAPAGAGRGSPALGVAR